MAGHLSPGPTPSHAGGGQRGGRGGGAGQVLGAGLAGARNRRPNCVFFLGVEFWEGPGSPKGIAGFHFLAPKTRKEAMPFHCWEVDHRV